MDLPLALPTGPAPRASGKLPVRGSRLHYEVTGSGPGLVFAHGLGGNHLSWWQQVPAFADRFTCVAFSHRGFAPSDMPEGGPDPADYADDLAALIAHLGLRDVVVVAQSMGGWTALSHALRWPGALRGMVLAATSGPVDPRSADAAAFAAWSAQSDAARVANRRDGVHPAAGARMAREQPAAHYLYRAIDALSATLDKEALRGRLMAGRTLPASALGAVATPTLWLTGAEDMVFASPCAPALAAAMPRARHQEIAAAGHSAYFERPAEFNAAVEAFLAALS